MSYKVSGRNKLNRVKERASYDKQAVYEILDAGNICHVGFATDGQPFVVPMLYARSGDTILLHGSVASRLANKLAEGVEACIEVTHIDGFVLARSTFHHSMNYRSVVAFGTANLVTDEKEKRAGLDTLVEFLTPNRSRDCREPNSKELNATHLLAFTIQQATAKVRTGGPKDKASDLDRNVWAGVVTIKQVTGEWIAADDLKPGIELPDYKEEIDRSV